MAQLFLPPAEEDFGNVPKDVEEFSASLEYSLDDFQKRACLAMTAGKGVLVAAPTGAGKTVVGQFAVFSALKQGTKAFYTTPIKALSNQKYKDFSAEYGPHNVGLLTGDTSINSEAPVVVMTTEVLRNMLYASSPTLSRLSHVVMDEVHYLGDKFRGAVWEEVIIHLPERVSLISLSATVSNAEEFGRWLKTLRGDTDIIVSEHRPVPLTQHVMVGREIIRLYASSNELPAEKVSGSSWINPDLLKIIRRASELSSARPHKRKFHEYYGTAAPSHRSRRHSKTRVFQNRYRPPNRAEIVKELARQDLLPGIDFIFSRKGCEAAVEQCLRSDITLTTANARNRIAAIIDELRNEIAEEDLHTIGFWDFRDALLRGFAAHHAGLLPVFKEVVEKLFSTGLITVVFATETLALGINMPARTVLIEKLDKYDGEAVVPLTSGQFTQLTGRAGRRGIDTQGHAIVLWTPRVNVKRLSSMISRRSYPLKSSFRPTYNMSINLVAQYGKQMAREILESSFAQYQTNKSVVRLAVELKRNEAVRDGHENSMECALGDVEEYGQIGRKLNFLKKKQSQERRQRHNSEASDKDRAVSGTLKESHRYAREDKFQRRRGRINALRRQLLEHPVHHCKDRDEHMRLPRRYDGLEAEGRLAQHIERRSNNIARTFDRICTILEQYGYMYRDDSRNLRLSPRGEQLKTLYGERDLLLSLCLDKQLLNDLKVPEFAAFISTFVYESRSESEFYFKAPTPKLESRFQSEFKIWDQLVETEEEEGIEATSIPDIGMVWPIYRWADGASLADSISGTDLVPGDFTRWTKQIIDVCDQLLKTTGLPKETVSLLRQAILSIRRGVVIYAEAVEMQEG